MWNVSTVNARSVIHSAEAILITKEKTDGAVKLDIFFGEEAFTEDQNINMHNNEGNIYNNNVKEEYKDKIDNNY